MKHHDHHGRLRQMGLVEAREETELSPTGRGEARLGEAATEKPSVVDGMGWKGKRGAGRPSVSGRQAGFGRWCLPDLQR